MLTLLSCEDDHAYVCNQGGSVFIATRPGTYTVTAPSGETATVYVEGVDIEYTDTEGNTIEEAHEITPGGLVPIYDGDINTKTASIRLNSGGRPEADGT